MNGSPIIVFPEFPAFGELEEEEVQNVLSYLASVPRWASHTHTHRHTSFVFVRQQTNCEGSLANWGGVGTTWSQQMAAQYKRLAQGKGSET